MQKYQPVEELVVLVVDLVDMSPPSHIPFD
jgi:hypothetical protein